MKADGVSGTIEIVGDEIRIKKKLFFGSTGGMNVIRIRDITAVKFLEPRTFVNGYIQFAYPGSQADRSWINVLENDRDTVIFHKGQEAAFQAIRDEVKSQIEAGKSKASTDPVAEIMRLGELRKDGLLTEEEFAEAKRIVLGLKPPS